MDSDKIPDERFEHRKGSAVEEGFGDVDESVVKKVLWKMDVRYACFHHMSKQPGANTPQDITGPLTPVLVLVHRPHECGQRKDPGSRGRPKHQRPSVRDWTVCFLRYIHCEAC